MQQKLSFEDQIRQLQIQHDHENRVLEKLEDELEFLNRQITSCRDHLERLRALDRGELPDQPEGDGEADDIERVETNPESGRPAPGARRKQIQTICRSIGSDGHQFRTREVLDRLAEVEDELTDGLRSYAYAVMDELEKENVVEKVGWGRWKLNE